MGYESKIYIVERYENERPDGRRYTNALILAEYDLCKMGGMSYAPEFYKAFRTEIDYTLLLPGYDPEKGVECLVEQYADCYGEHMKSADIGELIDALTAVENREHYRRIPPLVAMLTALKLEADEWNTDGCTLEVVHYGY